MTRPQIVRADTIDLQDQTSPSAQDHSRKPAQQSPLNQAISTAPHQAAELRHAQHERAAEEMAMSRQWNGMQGLSDEPPSEEEDMFVHGHSIDDGSLVQQNGHIDDADPLNADDDMDDDGMDKISSSPSITDEDIDFEFVYALHNFVATVEGQANAAKGDTMVLLDDSNSYWWLVRVVKDSTIGYLPAEHIETPTERLARLNKHRNIDACKMMYEDSLGKGTQNPLKRAMRRRGQKQVAFADPTYRDAPQYDYSSEEEEEDEGGETQEGGAEDSANGAEPEDDEITTASNAAGPSRNPDPIDDDERRGDNSRSSDDSDRIGPSVSRNGTVRNTDSFFRDESMETKKISLTPNLLRDDSTASALRAIDGIKDRGSSFELDKADRAREEKKKDKRGVLAIFKRRKDKKGKGDGESTASKTSMELSRDSGDSPVPSTVSERSAASQDIGLKRTGSKGKLQKTQARNVTSPTGLRPANLSPEQALQEKKGEPASREESPNKLEDPRVRSPIGGSIKQVAPETSDPGRTSNASRNPFADPLSSSHLTMPVDEAALRLTESPVQITAADAQPDNEPPALVRDTSSDSDDVRSLRDSPSPPVAPAAAPNFDANGHDSPSFSHGLVIGGALAAGGAAIAAATSKSSSPPHPSREAPPQPNGTPAPDEATGGHADRANSTSTTSSAAGLSSSPSTPVWSDASLRQYLEESGAADARDLLLLTRDTTGVVPVGSDHPLMTGLFEEERATVKEMGAALDGLLGGWLERKMRSRSASAMGKRTK